MIGIKYPLEVSAGDLSLTTSYSENLKEAILSVLSTWELERVMRPEYGIEDQVFNSVSYLPTLLISLKDKIVKGLEGFDQTPINLYGSLDEDGKLNLLIEVVLPDGIEEIEVIL